MGSVNSSRVGIAMGFRPSCEGPKAPCGEDFGQALRSKEGADRLKRRRPSDPSQPTSQLQRLAHDHHQ